MAEKNKKCNVGIIGCGKIFIRHIESIIQNDIFSLKAVCDIEDQLLGEISKKYKVTGYKDYKEMINNEDIDLAVIATPNSLHYPQAKFCLENNCDVLVEKPVCLNPELIKEIEKIAKENNRKAYSVLQVRLNPVVVKTKEMLERNILGDIRGASLTQRWQRPLDYFDDWRGDPKIGGGTLHECGIHYIDILCYLLGKPKVHSSSVFNAKHKKTPIEDTIYSLLDFGDYGGTLEVTLASEPQNIECSITIMGENGYIELGGKALDKITKIKLVNEKEQYKKIMLQSKKSKETNSYGNYKGSCPNHPELYNNLSDFDVSISLEASELISEIYEKAGVKYCE